jgi:hypothetical protein
MGLSRQTSPPAMLRIPHTAGQTGVLSRSVPEQHPLVGILLSSIVEGYPYMGTFSLPYPDRNALRDPLVSTLPLFFLLGYPLVVSQPTSLSILRS